MKQFLNLFSALRHSDNLFTYYIKRPFQLQHLEDSAAYRFDLLHPNFDRDRSQSEA